MSKQNANTNFNFLNKLDIDLDVKRRLSIDLARIYSGSNEVLETPLSREHGAHKLLSEWNEVFHRNKERMNETLLELEESNKGKFGPRSIALPWSQRLEGTKLYFEQSNLDYSALDANPEASRDKGYLRPLSIDKTINFLKNDTNSGLPFLKRKGLVKKRVLARFDYYLKRNDPCVLFTRTQEGRKTRDVWGYPIADTLNEMRYYRPLLDYQRKLHWRTAILGPENVDRKMTHIINKAMSSGLELISIDFSSYDRSLKQGMQRKVFEYYKYLFQTQYHEDLDYICQRKSTIGLVTPDGVMRGPHAEPSGSTFTNEDDSVCQYIIARKSNTISGDLYDIQGDDGAYAIASNRVNSLYTAFRRYGFQVNEEKSYRSSNYLIYLQNLFHVDYQKKGVIKGIYPTYRALNRILYQERWYNFEDDEIEGKDYYAIRAISILENCKNHPLFEELVKFVLKYDKYGLQPSRRGLRQYVEHMSQASGSEDFLRFRYGDDIKGIRSFETFKIIKSLGRA